MKYLLYILLTIMGGFSVAEAQQTNCSTIECGARPNRTCSTRYSDNSVAQVSCGNMSPIPEGKSCGWRCPEDPMPSSSFGGGQDDGNDKNLPDTETNTEKKPCNIEQIVAGWTNKKPTLPAFTAARAAAATARPKGFARSFMQTLGILPGDSCKPLYSDTGKKYIDCLTRVDGQVVSANNAWFLSQNPRPSRSAIFEHLAALRSEEPYICAKEQGLTVEQAKEEAKPIPNKCDKS